MRTTVRLDETLMRDVKSYAARHQRTITSVLEDALRRLLSDEQRAEPATRVDVIVFTGSGVRPEVDIADRSTWQDILDGEDATDLRASSSADS